MYVKTEGYDSSFIVLKEEYSFNDLLEKCWSGAIDTLKEIEKKGMEEDLMNLIQECFNYEIPTLTEVNDLLRFEDKFIFESLGIYENEEEE